VTPAKPLDHERAFELLPWLVNGSLAPAERDAVEEHVRGCIACRREAREQQRLQSALRSQPTVHVTPHLGFEQLDRALDGAAFAPPRSARARYAAAAPFAIAAAAGVALLAFLLWLSPPPAPATYSTLAAPGGGEPLVDVVFTQETTSAEIRSLLERIGGEIVGGPSSIGRYRVRVAGTETMSEGDAVARAIDELDDDPHVRLAVPAPADEAR
jgi:anti-sigma factor RsiW